MPTLSAIPEDLRQNLVFLAERREKERIIQDVADQPLTHRIERVVSGLRTPVLVAANDVVVKAFLPLGRTVKPVEQNGRAPFKALESHQPLATFVPTSDQGVKVIRHKAGEDQVASPMVGLFHQDFSQAQRWAFGDEEERSIKKAGGEGDRLWPKVSLTRQAVFFASRGVLHAITLH